MTQYMEGALQFEAAQDLDAYRLVKMSAAHTVNYAGEGDDAKVIGVTAHDVDSGDAVHVIDRKRAGTVQVTASEALTANDAFRAAANGKVQLPATAVDADVMGFVLETASGDGAVVEAYLYTDVREEDHS